MKHSWRFFLLFIYGGAGITALAYEILWIRMLSLLFGISIFGVVLTVAAFMAGLGAGSLVGAGQSRLFTPSRALLFVALIEGGIALYALLLPWFMPWLDAGLMYLGSGLSVASWQQLQGAALFLVLFPAAMAMGYAFPLALRAAAAPGLSLAEMYGVNALGGAVGALLPLFLLPAVGWRSALIAVASIGLLLAALAWWLSGRFAAHAREREEAGSGCSSVPQPPVADLLAYAGIGAAALILEVVWARLYGMVLLRTEYVLAVLLLVYLAGIGLGSLLARRICSATHMTRWLNILPVCAALLAVAGQYALPLVSQWASRTVFDSLFQGMVMQGGAVFALTLPVTLMLGAWLPLLVHRFTESEQSLSDETGVRRQPDGTIGGWWYGANSLGAALGALLAGFVFIPWLGSSATLGLGALLLLLCGMRWATGARMWLFVPILLLLFWPVRYLPPVSELLPALAGARNLSVFEDAVAITHVVEQPDGQRILLSDLQRMDASSDPVAVTVQKNQARLPLLLHPGARSILFLGLGTGISAAGSLPFVGVQRTAVELSAGAIRAAKKEFAPVNSHVMEKMLVLHDDARRFLRVGSRRYDVIVGDLFHPDMVGRANLLSVQQFKRVRERLETGGLFVQWLALNQFDIASLKVVLQSFRTVFNGNNDDALLFVDGYHIAMVGLKRGKIDSERLMQSLSSTVADEATGGEGLWTWLGRYWGRIPLYTDVPFQDEWAPVIEFSLPRIRFGSGMDPVAMWHWMLSWREQAPEAALALHVQKSNFTIFKRAWAATGLNVHLWLAELAADDRQTVRWAQLAHRANANDRWPSLLLADRLFASLEGGGRTSVNRKAALLRILSLRPDHEGAIRAIMHLELQQGNDAAAQVWRQRLLVLSPLAFDLRQR